MHKLLVPLLLVSGILSGLHLVIWEDSLIYLYLPGLIFGIAFSISQIQKFNASSVLKMLLWTLFSWAAYYAAFKTLFYIDKNYDLPVLILIPGFIGAFILSISARYLIGNISLKDIFKISGIGAILGIFLLSSAGSYLLVALIALWQLTVGVVLDSSIQERSV